MPSSVKRATRQATSRPCTLSGLLGADGLTFTVDGDQDVIPGISAVRVCLEDRFCRPSVREPQAGMRPCSVPSRGEPMRVRRRALGVMLAVTACVCSLALMLGGASAGASAASPSVTPATGGGGVPVVPGFTSFDPAVVGYEQSEVFLSGTASAYESTAPVDNDGKYSVGRHEHGPVHDPRRRDATGQSTPFQRDGRRGVVERQRRRRRGPGLDARTQRTGTRRVRLGRRLRAEGRCRRAQVGRSAAWRCCPLRQPVAPG